MKKWDKVLDDFQECSDKLERAISGLTQEQLDLAPEDGGWSIRQIIHHLADGACIWSLYVHQALAGKGGEFDLHWYWDIPQEKWAEIWDYGSREVGPSLALYRANQERLLTLLRKIENPDGFTLDFNVRDAEPSSVSILEAVRFQPIHLKEHLAEIKKILQK